METRERVDVKYLVGQLNPFELAFASSFDRIQAGTLRDI